MKKTLSIVAIAAISTSASAFDYKLNLEGRADFNHLSSESTSNAGIETTNTSNGFMSSLIRLNMVGNINDQLTYRMRYRFNKEGANTTRDDSTTNLDYLYVDHKNSIFTTRFGKMNWAEAYGRESFISTTDLFVASDAYAAYNTGIGNYRFGAAATFTFLETQKLTIALSNPNAANTDTVGESNNKSIAYAAHYSAVLFDKMFQPTLSYTLAPQDGDSQATTPTTSQDYTMMAAGFRTETMGLIVDADWKQFNRKARTTTAGATDGKTSSIFANVSYTVNEQLSPFVQFVNDKFENSLANTTNNYKKNTYVGGVMWKPFTDTNFRYHLAYSNSKKKFDSSAAAVREVQDNKITFGMKIDI